MIYQKVDSKVGTKLRMLEKRFEFNFIVRKCKFYSSKKYGILAIFLFERNAIGMKIENADI